LTNGSRRQCHILLWDLITLKRVQHDSFFLVFP
jgi:hypothetical protein